MASHNELAGKPKGNRNLMATIQKRMEAPAAAEAGAGQLTDQTERAQGLLRAKLGKAGAPGASPRISSMREKQAVSQAGQAAGRQQLEGALKGQQLEQKQVGIEAREEQQQLNIIEQQDQLKDRFARNSESILGDLERGKLDIKSKRGVAKLEQLGFSLRMQSKEYVANLERAGSQKRLENKLSFKEEIARQQFADDTVMAEMGADYRRISQQSRREFDQDLANMDMEYATEMAHQAEIAQTAGAFYKGMGGIVGGGAQTYDAYQKKPEGAAKEEPSGAPTQSKVGEK